MIEIVEQHPKFWKGKTDAIITIVNEISKGKIFQNSIRECALELVYSLAKSSPSSIKKSEQFKNQGCRSHTCPAIYFKNKRRKIFQKIQRTILYVR